MPTETSHSLSAIQEQVDTNDLQQELLTVDLSDAFTLRDDQGLLRLDSPHPNHPPELWYWIRYRPETNTLKIGISTETDEMYERVTDYTGDLGATGKRVSLEPTKRKIIVGEWESKGDDEFIAEVADEFYWLVAESHRIFA